MSWSSSLELGSCGRGRSFSQYCARVYNIKRHIKWIYSVRSEDQNKMWKLAGSCPWNRPWLTVSVHRSMQDIDDQRPSHHDLSEPARFNCQHPIASIQLLDRCIRAYTVDHWNSLHSTFYSGTQPSGAQVDMVQRTSNSAVPIPPIDTIALGSFNIQAEHDHHQYSIQYSIQV